MSSMCVAVFVWPDRPQPKLLNLKVVNAAALATAYIPPSHPACLMTPLTLAATAIG